MRLWSLHPCYLDAKGLVALWREALLARAVLRGRTSGYRHHPQLQRFRKCKRPVAAINCYLRAVLAESKARGYRFDASKLGPVLPCENIAVTEGQLLYEWKHLEAKLKSRDAAACARLAHAGKPRPHPMFKARAGGVESWEKVSTSLFANRDEEQGNVNRKGAKYAK